jgi:hypothetical protein
MGKTLENSQRNSPLRRLKGIQNVAPIPLFTHYASSFDKNWSRKENTQDMLYNYAHHAQSPKSSVHSVHKMPGKAI